MNRESWFGRNDKIMENIIVFFADIFYGFTKLLYMTFEQMINIVSSINILLTGSSSVIGVATSLYNKLLELFVVPIVLVVCAYYLYEFTMGSIQKANRYLVIFLLVLTVNVGFYAKGTDVIKGVLDITETVEKSIYSVATNSVLLKDNDKEKITKTVTTFDENDNEVTITTEQRAKKANDILVDYLFEKAIADPYMMLNFGLLTFDEDKAKEYLLPVGTENIVKGLEEIRGKIDKNKDELYLQVEKGTEKIWIALFSVINILVIGGGVTLIVLLKVIIQLLLLAMVIFFPLLSVLSFVPKFNHVIFKYLTQALGLSMLSPFLATIVLVVMFIFTQIDTVLSSQLKAKEQGIALFLFAIVLKILFLVLTWKGRYKLFALMATGNAMQTVAPMLNADVKRYSDDNAYNDQFMDKKMEEMAKNNQNTDNRSEKRDNVGDTMQDMTQSKESIDKTTSKGTDSQSKPQDTEKTVDVKQSSEKQGSQSQRTTEQTRPDVTGRRQRKDKQDNKMSKREQFEQAVNRLKKNRQDTKKQDIDEPEIKDWNNER